MRILIISSNVEQSNSVGKITTELSSYLKKRILIHVFCILLVILMHKIV